MTPEIKLMIAIDKYLSTQDFTNGYAFANDIQSKALHVWRQDNAMYIAKKGV